MNKNMIKTVLAGAMVAAALTACQSEPEVGSSLYPTAEENYDTKAYLYTGTGDDNKVMLGGVKSATDVTLANDSALIYVRLSSPADKDVTVSVAATAENVKTQGNEEVMGKDAIQLNRTTVTIPKGQVTASEPIAVKLKAGDDLKKIPMLKNGAVAVDITSVDGAAAGSSYNRVLVATNFSYENVTTDGELNYDKSISYDQYTMSTNLRGMNAGKLNDGSKSTYIYTYMSYGPVFTMAFKKETRLTGIGVLSAFTSYNYGVKEVEVFTSMDGMKWTRQGAVTAASPYDDDTPLPIVFSAPVTCKYAKVKMLSSFHTSSRPLFAVSEIWAFE